MDIQSLTPYRKSLLFASILGFLSINVPFLYIALFNSNIYSVGVSNGLAQVFMAEALLLMLFFAYLIHAFGWTKPGWFVFIVMSIVGSMAFSVPFYLYLISDPARRTSRHA